MQTHNTLKNGSPRVIILDRGNYTTCTIFLKGACITSWKIDNEEQIFISRISKLDDYNRFRGGVSLVFPHFGEWSFGRQHGFARDIMWQLKDGPRFLSSGDVYAELSLSSDSFTRSNWNYEFELHFSVTLGESNLKTKVVVTNTSLFSSIEFNIALHWFIKIKDIRKCALRGLKDCKYVRICDLYDDPSQISLQETSRDFRTTVPMHTIFYKTPVEFSLYDEEQKKLINIHKCNQPDLMAWNPGIKEMTDLEDGEYQYFLLLDTGNLFSKVVMDPNSSCITSTAIEVIDCTHDDLNKYGDLIDHIGNFC